MTGSSNNRFSFMAIIDMMSIYRYILNRHDVNLGGHMKQYHYLNQPFKLGNLNIRNRFVVAPMGVGFIHEPDGEINKLGLDYYERRAKGGFGLIYTGSFNSDSWVDPDNPLAANPLKNPAKFIKSSTELTRRIHVFDTKIIAQVTMGLGRNYPTYLAPSVLPVYNYPEYKSEELTIEQIKKKEEYMIEVAKLCKQGGYDGFEIHAMHWGYLLDEFSMSITNQRTDEYGGSVENRIRIAKELIEGIKEACGKDFVVTIRLGLKAFMKGFNEASFDGKEEAGRDIDEAIEIAKLLESYGLDGLSVDTGVYDSFYYACPPMYVPQGYAIDLAAQMKKEVGIPVMLCGRMGDIDLDEEAVRDGKIDAVVMGRPSLADPDLPKKVEMGLPERIRPCIACNQGCMYRLLEQGVDSYCAVNPELGKSVDYLPQPALDKKNIVVVGGGVAGMEAVRTLTRRGHKVSLYEKSSELGGNLIPAGAHAFKKEIHQLNDWYKQELDRMGVEYHLNTALDAEQIIEMKPDAVILAVGSSPVTPRVEGVEKALGCLDVLTGGKEIKDKVVVVGGGLVGCEIAYDLVLKGKDVTVVEGLDHILNGPVPAINKQFINDAFKYYGVKVRTGTMLSKVTDEGIYVTADGKEEFIEADSTIIAVGFRPNKSFARELYGHGFEVYEVGDGAKVGDIYTSIGSAFEISRII